MSDEEILEFSNNLEGANYTDPESELLTKKKKQEEEQKVKDEEERKVKES